VPDDDHCNGESEWSPYLALTVTRAALPFRGPRGELLGATCFSF
jgi:hypothetical protein